jgi:hypothetical protein
VQNCITFALTKELPTIILVITLEEDDSLDARSFVCHDLRIVDEEAALALETLNNLLRVQIKKFMFYM